MKISEWLLAKTIPVVLPDPKDMKPGTPMHFVALKNKSRMRLKKFRYVQINDTEIIGYPNLELAPMCIVAILINDTIPGKQGWVCIKGPSCVKMAKRKKRTNL